MLEFATVSVQSVHSIERSRLFLDQHYPLVQWVLGICAGDRPAMQLELHVDVPILGLLLHLFQSETTDVAHADGTDSHDAAPEHGVHGRRSLFMPHVDLRHTASCAMAAIRRAVNEVSKQRHQDVWGLHLVG